jgi:hemoglobin/transferrin/lactoferrin receptor protein
MIYRFIFFLFLLISKASFAQNVTVLDSEFETPISGVAFFTEDKSVSKITNIDGVVDLSNFSTSDVIVIKHISYLEKIITKSSIVNNKVFLISNLQDLDEIILSASKFSENKIDIPRSIIRIDAKTIGFSNPQTSADALEGTGKVYVQKSQLGGGSPIIRGFSTNRLLLTVDGVRMNNAIFRSGNIQNVISVDPFTIENTEVTLGAGTVIYGSDAIGGVVSFNTIKPRLSHQDSLHLNSSSTVRYATASQEQTIHTNLNLGAKKWAFLSSFTLNKFDDLRMGKFGPDNYLSPEFITTSNNTDLIIKNQNPLVQKESGYSQVNFMQKVLYQPINDLDFNLGLFYTKTSDVPRYDRLIRYNNEDLLRSAEWFYGPQKWFMANFQLDYKRSSSLFYDNLKLNIAYQNFNESRTDRDYQSIVRSTREEIVNAYSFNFDLEKIFNKKSTLYYGLEYVYNKVGSLAFQKDIETGVAESIVTRYPNNSSWQSMAAYFNYKYKPSKNITLQSGLRYNNIISKANFDENNVFLNLPFNSANNSHNALTGSLGISWVTSRFLEWKANFTTAFRAPNIDDVGKVFDSEPGSVVVPNNNLKPEYAYNGELGMNLNFSKSFKLDIATYYTLLDNALIRRDGSLNGNTQIIYNGDLSQVQSIQNASKSKIYGFEFGAFLKFSKSLKFNTQYNVVGGFDEINNTKSPSRHVVPSFGNSHLTWENKKLKLDAFVNFNGELSNNQLADSELDKDYIYALDTNNNPYAPSWYTFNITTQYQINPNTTLTTSLENISDQRYKTYSSGIAAPGRNLIVALKYTL